MMNDDFDMNALPQWLADVAAELSALNDYKTVARVCGMAKGSLANLCADGMGPQGAVTIAKKKMFPKREVLAWMLSRAQANATAAM